ncbi:hypothetical protein [Streptomyces sp. AD55]|uniref:hypothetical protein n=1 Tax=Streptomyces sp. AD55 TaxID=3242895 RepID=UPI0035298582
MAHQALPTSGTPGTARGPSARPREAPDVFGERTHRAAHWMLPVVLGLVYGYWVAANRRFGGPITGWNVFYGFMTALAFAVLYAAVRAVAGRLPREGHAALWAAFTGSALGFLYTQTGVAMFTCIGLSLVVAAATFLVLFYRYYTHEDAAGRRVA